MKNLIKANDCDIVDIEHTSALTAGVPVYKGTTYFIPITDGAANEQVACYTKGQFSFPRLASQTGVEEGTTVYWDEDNGRVTTVAGDLNKLGKCIAIPNDSDDELKVQVDFLES